MLVSYLSNMTDGRLALIVENFGVPLGVESNVVKSALMEQNFAGVLSFLEPGPGRMVEVGRAF